MNLIELRKSFHLNRSKQIAGVLLSHGWDFLKNNEEQTDTPTSVAAHARPLHLRLALEELGTTFIKLGQILSTRADLVPPDYLAELTKLQDSAPPVAFEEIQQALVAELNQPIEEVFAQFDPVPLAAASIGQVHAAILWDGTEVVVKIPSLDLAKFGVEMPHHLRRIVTAAENGNLQIGMRPEGFDPIIDRLERIANRIVLGVIAAAFINGLAVLVSVYSPPVGNVGVGLCSLSDSFVPCC